VVRITTKIAGGVVGYRIALTLEANYAAAIGDCVMGGPGDFQCVAADGSLPILGDVIMPNVKRGTGALAGTYPQANVPGDVSIGVRGHAVQTKKTGAAVTVGAAVGINAAGLAEPVRAARSAASTGTTSGSATVTDPGILALEKGATVTGAGIPANTFVGTVAPGASYLLSSSPTSQVNVLATATGTITASVGGSATYGIALNGATGAGTSIDVLVQ